jgi:hypothetical protein
MTDRSLSTIGEPRPPDTVLINRRALGEALMATLITACISPLTAAQAAQADRPVIVFVHGNFENAGFWQELIWRFESNRRTGFSLLNLRTLLP